MSIFMKLICETYYTSSKGLAPSVLPSASVFAHAVFAKFSAGYFCKKSADIRYNFFIKVSTIGFRICPCRQIQFCSLCYAKSCDVFTCHSLKKFPLSIKLNHAPYTIDLFHQSYCLRILP